MPPKIDINTLIAKRDNAIYALKELFEEFETIFAVEPQLERLQNTFDQIELKYRSIKKQQDVIADRLVEDGSTEIQELIKEVKIVGEKIKSEYLAVAKAYAVYQKKSTSPSDTSSSGSETLEAMTYAVKKMAETMMSPKPNSGGLERLAVPTWDGGRRSYSTWKKEFNHWMKKCSQDKDEQLQRFRKAMPKGFWWTEQVKTCKDIDRAWSILDIEFEDKRKLMDELLAGINKQKQVKRDSKSLTHYATLISGYVNDMADNDCSVTSSSDAPFFMSQLLSKLEPRDNADFGREMQRMKKEENVTNLVNWLYQEASIRSRGKQEPEEDNVERSSRGNYYKRSDNHAATYRTPMDQTCPLGCTTKHLLAACPSYQSSTVDERWEIVKKEQRCRKCLRASHHTKDCWKAEATSCDQCKKDHHRSLHNERKAYQGNNLNPDAPAFSNQEHDASRNYNVEVKAINNKTKEVKTVVGLCPIQKVRVVDSSGHPIEVLAMLDTGSNTSLISKGIAMKLGLMGIQTHLTMNLAGGEKRYEVSEVLDITVTSSVDENIQKPLRVYTVRKPCSSAQTISRASIESYPHLKAVVNKLHLAGGAVDLLLGTDFAEAFVDVHTLSGDSGEPIAKMNCFGWYILGQLDQKSTNCSGIQSVNICTTSIIEDVNKLLQQDQMGLKPTQLCTCSENELRENKFVRSLSESTVLVDGRIQVKMPWKEQGPPKRSNYDIALKRMYSAEKSFEKRGYSKVVDEEIQKLVNQGFVVKVPPEKVDHSRPEWYLPLQAVFTPEKSTTVRLVFDSSSKGHDGLSLNDHLEKGPNYINELPSVLTAWRWDEVAYSGDVRKMFNQVLVHPEDQIYHRFLWRKEKGNLPTIYQWLRLSFGDKPAPDIASNSINTLAKASQSEFPDAAKELQEHVYVDDIGGSRPTVEEVKQVTDGIDNILGKGQFEIKSWHSNHKEVDQSDGERFTDLLGHKWDKESDRFTFKKREIVGQFETFTKRNCLALVAQLWDPIGLVSPVTIKFRIHLQELWQSGFGWDDVLPESLQKKWKENLQIMNYLLTFEFDRKLKPSNATGLPEIHGFSDGGEQGFGAVIFLRWTLVDGSFYCVPVMIKPFVAPLKKKSIPRLELLGCLALSRMCETCEKTLDFAKIKEAERILWVDSTTVLSWIKTPPREFRPFVSARVAEIQETVGTENFRYVRSDSNPADVLTRGIEPEKLVHWLEGPSFLKLPRSDWPQFQVDTRSNIEIIAEAMKEKKAPPKTAGSTRKAKEINANSLTEDKTDTPILSHLLASCSSFSKVRRTLAFILRFTQNARKKNVQRGPISVSELKSSENILLKWCQVHLDVTSLDKRLSAQEDQDGLIRVHGRLENIRSLPDDLRNPVLLPRNHPLVYLLLHHLHGKRGHCGYKSLMYEARKRFWIVGLRGMAKFLTSKCVVCKKLRKKPLEQLMGQVPKLRSAAGLPAFSNTAIDMFGPVQIRINRKTLKEAQVIIFACMTTRAIHLELVSDKSTDTFLMAFRRFACLRGHPNNCWSDCGTNFVGAQGYFNEIIQDWDFRKIQSILSEEFACDFNWLWNVPHASHQNGVVESLIKSVRQGLNSTCKNQAFTEEQWRTFLTEINYLINSRPLYPSSNSVWESPPITPNDILIGQHSVPPQPEPEDKINPRHLLRSTENRVKEFWDCWMKYFAPNLLPRNKWFRTRENVQVGDLVLELDPKLKRCQWKMALITDTYPGEDGLVRKVRIKTEVGEYDRPIHKLCLIATKQELNTEDK